MDIKELDPLFRTPPGQAASDASTGSDLSALDPIFSNPIGTTSTDTVTTTAVPNKGSVFGLPKNEERGLAAATGAIAGPSIQKVATAAFPSAEVRQAEALKKMQEAAKLEATKQEFIKQELMKRGINPADLDSVASKSAGTKWIQNWAGQDKTIAGGVPEAAQAYQRGKAQGPISSRYEKRFGMSPREPGMPVQSTVDRLLENARTAEETAAKTAQATQQAETAAAAKMAQATPGPLSRMGTALKAPFTTGALGGAGAGLSFYEAYDRYMKGDTSGAVIAALGGVGGLMTMVPGLQAPGLALGLGSIPLQYANEYIKGNSGQQPMPTPIATPAGR
jgi:hypothetical protein